MRFGPALRIAAVAAVAVVGLIGLVAHESLARAGGAEVVLQMGAVDPRGLLSGDYVAINLQAPLTPTQVCPPGIADTDGVYPSPKRPPVWIALARQGDHFAPVGAASDRAVAARFAPLVVRGRPICDAPVAPSGDQGSGAPGWVGLDLGVDRFYADQAEATAISQTATTCSVAAGGGACPVSAIVSVGADGAARLKGLLVNGRRIELALF